MKQSDLNTSNNRVRTVDVPSRRELTSLTLSLKEMMDERLLWNVKVISILQQGQKWNESSEITLQKIYDFCSNEITQYEKEVLPSTQIGASDMDTNLL